MRRGRLTQRLAYLAATLAVVGILVACGSGSTFTFVETETSEGRVAGLVLDQNAQPAPGLLATASPASLTSPASVTTGPDGRYELRAPTGEVTVTFTGAEIQTASVQVTVTPNETVTAPDVVVAPKP